MSAVLLQGDCLELMKTLNDKSIDCFICDLPYGQLSQGFAREGHTDELKKKVAKQTEACCSWDVKIDLAEFWTQVKRLAKDSHTPILMFCNTKFGFELYNSNPSWFRYDLVWDKARGVSFLLANKMPMKSHEMIYVFSKSGAFYKRIDMNGNYNHIPRLNKKNYVSNTYDAVSIHSKDTSASEKCALSVINFKNKQSKGAHPTQKPMELYKWLLERYCPAGGTVLDPTAGSFNSILVAKELGLKGIGIEKDEKFFKTAQGKFATHELQTSIPRNEVVFASAGEENVAPEENEVD